MCCFFITLFALGPRFAFLIYWMIYPKIVANTFDTFIIPLLGFIFLPWTTLMVVIVAGANGIVGWDWLWVALSVAADVASYTSAAMKRKEVPYYPETAI